MKRKAIPLKNLYAAALLDIDFWREKATGERVIPYEAAKGMTPEQIRARWRADHWPVPYARREFLSASGISDVDHPANLTHRPPAEHDRKTAKRDIPELARDRRLAKRRGVMPHNTGPIHAISRHSNNGGETWSPAGHRATRSTEPVTRTGGPPKLYKAGGFILGADAAKFKRKIRSKGFDKTRRKRMDGTVVKRGNDA